MVPELEGELEIKFEIGLDWERALMRELERRLECESLRKGLRERAQVGKLKDPCPIGAF